MALMTSSLKTILKGKIFWGRLEIRDTILRPTILTVFWGRIVGRMARYDSCPSSVILPQSYQNLGLLRL